MSNSTGPSARSWLKPFLSPFKSVFREVVAMSFFVNLLALAAPIFTLQVYNRVVASAGISTLQGLIIGMILVLIFDYVLRQSRARILQTVALRVDVLLGRRLFRKLMRLPLQTLESKPSTYWSSLFRDVDVVRNTLSGSSALLLADLPFALLFLVLIFVIAAPVAWVLLVMLPVFMFVAWRSSNVMAEASGEERQSSQTRDSLIGEMIAGRTTIKALALDRSMEPVWEVKHAENIENSITRGSKTDGYANLGATLSLVTSLMLTTVGALAIIDQNLTIGALIATNMLSGRIMGPLNQLVGMWRTYSSFLQATERLGLVFTSNAERDESEVRLEKPEGRITIEDVVFAYSENLAPVVTNVSLEMEIGGIHALVGRNGSGKTTLLKIIQGLYQPQKGRVLMDGADIAQFTRSELADWLGYVPQESVLFAGTVRDNIVSRVPNADDDAIIKAATEAGVHHFIIDLPDGYATEIGEAGSRLSGGQRQRIAIARALVGDPPVVLLDEPSSSLDRHAEYELKDTLTKIAKTRTVIIVSHSPALLSACDFLYALDHGKLALAGPAREVLPRLFGGKMPASAEPTAAKPANAAVKGGNVPAKNPDQKPKAQLKSALAQIKPIKVPASQAIPGTPPPKHIKTPLAPLPTSPKPARSPVVAKIGPARKQTAASSPARPAQGKNAPSPVMAKIGPARRNVKKPQKTNPLPKAKLAAVLRSQKKGDVAIPASDLGHITTSATPRLRQQNRPIKTTASLASRPKPRATVKVSAALRKPNNR